MAISIILILLGFILITIKVFRVREKYALYFEYITTIIATIVGVYLALYVTNQEQEKDRKTKSIKIVNMSISSLSAHLEFINALDTLYNQGGQAIIPCYHQFIKKNIRQFPSGLQHLIDNEISVNYLSETIAHQIRNELLNIETTYERFNNIDQLTREQIGETIRDITFLGNEILVKLSWEKEYLEGEISEKELDERVRDRIDQLMKRMQPQIKK